MGDTHPLRAWREAQAPDMTLDAAAAGVGTVRQVWWDWESGRRIPNRTFMARIYELTRGAVSPNDFYDLPPLGQLPLPLNDQNEAPSLFDAADAEPSTAPRLQAAA